MQETVLETQRALRSGSTEWDLQDEFGLRLDEDAVVFCVVRSYRNKAQIARILSEPSYRYAFGDGWTACVTVREVDAKEARRLRRQSGGFCGYDWMIREIENHGRIRPFDERSGCTPTKVSRKDARKSLE